MHRLGAGDGGDGVHQLLLDLLPLGILGNVGVIADGFAEENFPQFGCQIHGHEAQPLTGTVVIHPGEVNEPILKVAKNIVVPGAAFREDDHAVSFLQFFHGAAEGGEHPAVPVDGDGLGVAHQVYRRIFDQSTEEPIEPLGIAGLILPEIVISILADLVLVHHLGGTPGIMVKGEPNFGDHGSMNLGMIPNEDTGFLGDMLCADQFHFRVDPTGDPPYQAAQSWFFNRTHPMRLLSQYN